MLKFWRPCILLVWSLTSQSEYRHHMQQPLPLLRKSMRVSLDSVCFPLLIKKKNMYLFDRVDFFRVELLLVPRNGVYNFCNKFANAPFHKNI